MRIFLAGILFFLGFIIPSPSFASKIELKQCIEVAHCVREEWKVNNIYEPFNEIKQIIENTPRSEIVQLKENYLHAEVTSKWMKYVDDLEISYLPESNKLLIRSESRVGDSDLGVNQKRVDSIKDQLF